MIFTKKIQFVGVYLQPALKFKMAHRTYSNLKTQGVNKQISRAISSETILKESTDKNNKDGETSFIILNSQKDKMKSTNQAINRSNVCVYKEKKIPQIEKSPKKKNPKRWSLIQEKICQAWEIKFA